MSEVLTNTPNILDIVHHERRGHTRCNSTGKALNGVRILSRYLRPSLSSCHDFCKFGAERTLEIKARGLLVKPQRSPATLVGGLDVDRSSISADRKKKLALRLESFPASKTQKFVFPILNDAVSPLTTEQTVVSGQVAPSVKEIELCVEDQKMKAGNGPKANSAKDSKVKPLKPIQGSRRIERCSNNEGQVKIETRKERGNTSTDSPSGSSSQRSEAKRSKEIGSFVTGERKTSVPPSIISSCKHSPKKVSSRNSQNSNNVTEVSHFSNEKTIRKPQPEQPTWEDIPEKILYVVDPNAEEKTSGPTKNVICVAGLSPPSFSSHQGKSLGHAQKGGLTAQPSTLSSKRNLRHAVNGTSVNNSTSSQPPSTKQILRRTQGGIQAGKPTPCPPSATQNSRRMQSGIQAADSPSSCPSTAKQNSRPMQSGMHSANSPPSSPSVKQNLRRIRSGIQAAASPPSCPLSEKQNLRRTQSQIQSANSSSSHPLNAKQNLSHAQRGLQATNSARLCPSSPTKRGSRGTQLGTRTSRLASLTTYSSASTEPVKTDSENQIIKLKREYKNSPREGGLISPKDESVPGKKLAFRRGKIVDIHPVDSTPMRLKFKCAVLGVRHSGKGDASKETPGKKEANTAQLPPSPAKKNSTHTENRTCFSQSRLSWPPSPKNKGLRENQKLNLEKEYENRPRKDRPSTSKDEQNLGQKLTFRKGKLLELLHVDGTPTRLKFKKRVPNDSQNVEADAGRKTIETKEATAFQLSFISKKNSGHTKSRIQFLRLSCPSSPKEKGFSSTEFVLGSGITRSYSCTSSLTSLSMNGDETDTKKRILDLENEFKTMHEMDGTTSLKKESDPAQKLTFRRGKVVDIINPEDTASRRLKFKRRERLFGDSNQRDTGTKFLGKQEIIDGTKTESKDVVWKHQDVEGKNSGSLLNNVIEETVSKLVKTRTSKVKALVGAFESVMSLRDTKPGH